MKLASVAFVLAGLVASTKAACKDYKYSKSCNNNDCHWNCKTKVCGSIGSLLCSSKKNAQECNGCVTIKGGCAKEGSFAQRCNAFKNSRGGTCKWDVFAAKCSDSVTFPEPGDRFGFIRKISQDQGK
jgi:hypothetical protein